MKKNIIFILLSVLIGGLSNGFGQNNCNFALASNGSTISAISEGTYLGETQYAYRENDGNSSTEWYSDWDILEGLQVEFNQIYDIGSIGMRSGTLATIPSFWTQSDGTRSTPDLINGFIYRTTFSKDQGTIDGTDTYSLTTLNLPSLSPEGSLLYKVRQKAKKCTADQGVGIYYTVAAVALAVVIIAVLVEE